MIYLFKRMWRLAVIALLWIVIGIIIFGSRATNMDEARELFPAFAICYFCPGLIFFAVFSLMMWRGIVVSDAKEAKQN